MWVFVGKILGAILGLAIVSVISGAYGRVVKPWLSNVKTSVWYRAYRRKVWKHRREDKEAFEMVLRVDPWVQRKQRWEDRKRH